MAGVNNPQDILAELDRVLTSNAFANADRPARLLRFLVEETVAGRGTELKESVLAVEVLGRSPGFDPKTDPIARVEVSRLRSRLEMFHASEGRDSVVRITLPKGTYVPVFETVERPVPVVERKPSMTRRPSRKSLIWAIAVGAAAFSGIWTFWLKKPSDNVSSRLSILTPTGTNLQSIAVSPDGRSIAFAAAAQGISRLYFRRLDSFTIRAVPNSETASFPFWSPDGKSVAFFTQGKLKVVDIAGGPARTLCDASLGRGGTWSTHGDILFAPSVLGPLFRISSAGGKPVRVTALNASRGEDGHRWPRFLPDGRHFLYFAAGRDPELSGIDVGVIDSETGRRLTQASSDAILVPADGRSYLLYGRSGVLNGQAFDPSGGTVTGEAFVVVDQVRFDPLTGYTFMAASNEGLLAYVAGSPYDQELVWVDRTGGELGRVAELSDYLSMRISPDGSHTALNRSDPRSGRPGIWNLDLTRGSMYPVDSQAVDWFPVWSPDGAKVVFSRAPGMELEIAPATGGSSKLLAKVVGPAFPSDWSLDGSWLAYTGHSAATGAGVWILPMGEREIRVPRAFIDSEHNEGGAVFSPAYGQQPPAWIAYTSNESGRDEVYVRSFPNAGRKMKVSLSGGSRPLWRADGKEIYFVDSQSMVMVLAVRNGHTMDIAAPKGLFRIAAPPTAPPYALNYATRDGNRFLVRKARAEGEIGSIAILTHWHP